MNAPPRPLHIRGVAQPPVSTGSVSAEWHVDYAEALRVVKDARGWWVYIRAGQFAPLKDTSRNTKVLTEGLEVANNVCVSKRIALKYIKDTYETLQHRVNIRISTCGSCLFIGS